MLAVKDFYPDQKPTVLEIMDAINSSDVVRFHAINSDKKTAGTGTFDTGAESIMVNNATKIEGVSDYPGEPSRKPVIKGTSGWLYVRPALSTDYLHLDVKALIPNLQKWINQYFPPTLRGNPFRDLRVQDAGRNCGIFNIRAADSVEITNLRLEHAAAENPLAVAGFLPEANSMHGTSTITYFADNTKTSTLMVTDCEIDTTATSGISIDAVNAPISNPIPHNVIIRHCQIKGRPRPDLPVVMGAGNYISVKLGRILQGTEPIDMRNAVFEVSDCDLDSAHWAGVVGAVFQSDKKSMFVVSENRIGLAPLPSAVTPCGVIFLDPALTCWPKGTITIIDNEISLTGYFQMIPNNDGSVGIWVQVNNTNTAEDVKTIVMGNVIDFQQLFAPVWAAPGWNQLLDGIIYEDLAGGGSKNATAVIQENKVTSTQMPPLRGIGVRNSAHDVTVVDNDLTCLTASHAQIFVDTAASDCLFSANLYGSLGDLIGGSYLQQPKAALLCEGSTNRFLMEDFSASNTPGWTGPGGLGWIKLAGNLNVDILDAQTPETQWIASANNTVVTLPAI